MDRKTGLYIAAQIAEESNIQFDHDIANKPGALHDFREALIKKGFLFSYLHQTLHYMPKEKDTIVPLVLQYLKSAETLREKKTLLQWLHFKGLYSVVPELIHEFRMYAEKDQTFYGWALGDTLYQIRCPHYAKEYIELVKEKKYGVSRQMVVLLLGNIKCYESEAVLLSLLSDDDITLHVLSSLGKIGDMKCISALEQYLHSSKSAQRKEAKLAIERIQKRCVPEAE